MMKTLFLQPPSFDGFDGGAGSRYQARREIRSFWYPDLARPAGRAGGGQQADRRPAGRHRPGRRSRRQARDYELCVIHTSTPSFGSDVKVAAALKAGQSGPEDRLHRRQGGGAAGGEPDAGAPAIDFVARNEFDFTIKEVAEGRDFAAVDGISYRNADGAIVHNTDRADPRGHGPAAVRHRGLQARPAHRELLHRLPEAPLRLALHRPRLQIALHLLPVAADRRRPPLPHALAGARGRGDRTGQAATSRR